MSPEFLDSDSDTDDGFRIVRFGDVHEPGLGAPAPAMMGAQPRRAQELAGGTHGLERLALLGALETLRAAAVAIESIEVVRAVCERPLYTLERRTYERGMGESFEQWCRRTQHQARDFVVTFADPGDGSIRFVLAVAEG